jgi:large conductance mechanosensitive channel
VTGFISGIVMPVVGVLTAGVDFMELKYVLRDAELDATGNVVVAESAIMYGQFITVLIDFIIIAFVMFLVVKAMNKAKKKQAEAPVAPPAPTEEQKLLMEIRDLLKK